MLFVRLSVPSVDRVLLLLCLLACLPIYLLTDSPAYMHTRSYLLGCLLTYLLACLANTGVTMTL